MSNETTKLISLIQIAQPIEGRKKLQKIVYILQNEDVDFGKVFKYAIYGPYSVDLQLEINKLVLHNVLNETTERNSSYSYVFNNENHYYPSPVSDQEVKSKESLIKYLNSSSSQELELVATIYFLKNKGEEYADDEMVKIKIDYLKPHLSNKIDSAFRIYNLIKTNNYRT